MIDGINSYRQNTAIHSADVQQKNTAKDDKQPQRLNVGKDVLEKGTATSSVTYSKSHGKKLSSDEIQTLKNQVEYNYENLRNLVKKMLSQQGYASIEVGKLLNQPVDKETITKAQQAISPEGEYGVEAVSDRLLNFAIAISGNDKEKYELLKTAIEKGFAEAEKAWGGKLPDICYKTFEATMEKLEKWKQEE